MANITALLAALSNLPTVGGAPLTPLPAPVNAPTDFNLPGMLAGPEPPPVAPAAPLDQSFIANRLALLGAAPVAPPASKPAGILDKIFAVLGGIGAGMQGQGPQFAASLREERQRPQREYEAKLDRYNQQRAQLGLGGLEAAESARDRQQARETAAADRRFQMDYKKYERELDLKDDREKMLLNDMLLSRRQREDDERQAARQAAAQKAQQERDARLIEAQYGKIPGIKPAIAKELGRYYANLSDGPLSPAAANFESTQSKIAELRARKLAAGGGGGGGGGGGSSVAAQKALAQFESVKQQVADAVARGDAAAEMQLRRTMNAAFNRLARFPGQFDLSYDQTGMWPSATPRAAAGPQSTAGRMGLQSSEGMNFNLNQAPGAPQQGGNRAAAKAKLIANGYSSAEADAELNRLGIK